MSADVTPEEAEDFVTKLMTESTRVEGMLTSSSNRIRVSLMGTVRRDSDGTVLILADAASPGSSYVRFDPSTAVRRSYAESHDRSLVGSEQEVSLVGPFISILVFALPDGSNMALLELSDG